MVSESPFRLAPQILVVSDLDRVADSSHFSRAFGSAFGKPPGAFRRTGLRAARRDGPVRCPGQLGGGGTQAALAPWHVCRLACGPKPAARIRKIPCRATCLRCCPRPLPSAIKYELVNRRPGFAFIVRPEPKGDAAHPQSLSGTSFDFGSCHARNGGEQAVRKRRSCPQQTPRRHNVQLPLSSILDSVMQVPRSWQKTRTNRSRTEGEGGLCIGACKDGLIISAVGCKQK